MQEGGVCAYKEEHTGILTRGWVWEHRKDADEGRRHNFEKHRLRQVEILKLHAWQPKLVTVKTNHDKHA